MAKKKKLKPLADRKADVSSNYWLTKANNLWSKLVRDKAENRCEVCGAVPTKKSRLNAHHLFDKARKDTRHVIENGICLCPSHHKFLRQISPHRGPVAFFNWLMIMKPLRWSWLVSHISEPEQPKKPDYKAAYETLLKATHGN